MSIWYFVVPLTYRTYGVSNGEYTKSMGMRMAPMAFPKSVLVGDPTPQTPASAICWEQPASGKGGESCCRTARLLPAFGAFKYAMKRGGFAMNGTAGTPAKANGDTFANSIEAGFFAVVVAADLQDRMILQPPERVLPVAGGCRRCNPRTGSHHRHRGPAPSSARRP